MGAVQTHSDTISQLLIGRRKLSKRLYANPTMDVGSVDIAMPTYESSNVIETSLKAAKRSFENSSIEVNNLIVVDNHSSDGTPRKVQSLADDFRWNLDLIQKKSSLPVARQTLINNVETDWFLFLDDDAIVTPSYLSDLTDAISPLTGAVQGKKAGNDRSPASWVHRRSMRGGTHATLVRHAAADGVDFPLDLVVLEDEFLRRYIENDQLYLWVFNHQATFEHENQFRHFPGGWQEGYLAGKYDLRPSYRVLVDIPASIKALNNPRHQVERTVGYIAGKLLS